jgi:transglutaminase-like putative cysteine protease
VTPAPPPGDAQRIAQDTGWNPRRDPPPEVQEPREAYSATVRELDRNTRSPTGARLEYREVFTPSVAPFKRRMAYDAVDELGRLTVRDPSLRPVTVGGLSPFANEPARRFTGDLQVAVRPDAPTPVPSVGPEEHLVTWAASPPSDLGFFRDSAGNLFARGSVTATLRLTYVLEVPERAFHAVSLPTARTGEPLPGFAPPLVPPFLQTASEPVLQALGLQRGMPLDTTLRTATAWFRDFRDDVLPNPPGPSLYLDLALGRVGACRHRAYAFVLTLHALGVPARFVNNEAHAWAEVALPGQGFSRVDLGGWDVELHTENTAESAPFVPANPDPLPRPANYENGYSTQHTPQLPTARHTPPRANPEPPTVALPPEPMGDARQNVPVLGTNPPAEPGGRGVVPGGGGPGRPGGGASTGAGVALRGDDSEEAPRVHPTLRIETVRAELGGNGTFVRGSMVLCVGEARDDQDRPIADLPVRLVLLRSGAPPVALGTTATRADGRFEARVLLPVTLQPGDYEFRVSTDGDALRAPADGA